MNGNVQSSQDRQPYRLGRWEIYPDSGDIVCGQESDHLEPRTMDVLCALAFQPDRTLSRDELISQIWGDVVVTDDALTRVIYKLRQQLGDDPQQPRYIQTLPKLGYRIVVKPQTIGSAQQSTEQKIRGQKKSNIGMMALLLTVGLLSGYFFFQFISNKAVDQVKQSINYSIAVLPFADFRSAEPGDHLAESITDELINSLANLKQLQVVSRTSVFSLKDRPDDIRQLGVLLNANTIVEGSIRRSGDHLRLIIQLIDVKSGFHLLSETIERQPDDIFSFTAQVIPSITSTLGIKTDIDELTRATAVPANSEAQRLTIQGRYHWYKRKQQSLQKALEYFEQAIQLAPDYAPGWSGLSDTLVFSTLYGNRKLADIKSRARSAVDRALQLDPGLADAYASLGLLQLHLKQHPSALESLQQAIKLNPNNAMAHMWLGRTHFASGRFLQAMLAYQRGATLDPISPVIYLNIGMAGLLAGETEDAESAYHKSIEFDPENLYTRWALAYLLWSKGDLQKSESLYAEIIQKGLKRADVIAQASILALDSGDINKAKIRLELAKSLDDQDDWVTGADWSYLMSQHHYDQIQLAGQTPSNDELARQALAGLLNNDFQFALEKYSLLLGQKNAGNDILFDKWDIEWGFSHALYLQQLYLRLGDKDAALAINIKLDEYFQQLLKQGLKTAGTDYISASLAAVNNRPEQAITHLTTAINRGWSKLWWLKQDPAFELLRDHSGYKSLVIQLISRISISKQDNSQKLLFSVKTGNKTS